MVGVWVVKFQLLMLALGLGGCAVGVLYQRGLLSFKSCYRLTLAGMVLTVLLTVGQIVIS